MGAVSDTAPEVAEIVHARLMALFGAERFLMGCGCLGPHATWCSRRVLADLPDAERNFFSIASTESTSDFVNGYHS